MTLKEKKVLFYSSVRNLESFQNQQFYQIDIELIKNLGCQLKLTNQIFDFLYFWKYDIAFIYFYRKGLIPAILSRFFLKKVYFTGGIDDLNRNTTLPKHYKIQKLFFKLCNYFSTKSILVSISDKANVEEIYNKKLPSNIGLSFHSINSKVFNVPDISKKETFFTTIVWMESIGNVKRKGVDKALYVFKSLTEKNIYCNAKFYIIGKTGEGTEFLKEICRDLNLSEKVIFTGSIDERLKIDLLKKSKYYFQLSTFEGFGLAALEALAAKNIIIHSAKGGLKETMKNYGVIIDINLPIVDQIETIYKQLLNFNEDILSEAYRDVSDNYSNESRQKYFEKVFTN
ncbi:glycosyltransferase [Flavobacterium sp.]|uniref:glycosyltransferase n=1 Tax=Flavobacterium sp. TaxID=239 RepID=UPI002ED81061